MTGATADTSGGLGQNLGNYGLNHHFYWENMVSVWILYG